MKTGKEILEKKYGPPVAEQESHDFKSIGPKQSPSFILANQKKAVNPPFTSVAAQKDEEHPDPRCPFIRDRTITTQEFRMKLNLESHCGPKDCCCIERKKLWEEVKISEKTGRKYLKKWKERSDIIWKRSGRYNVFLLLYLTKNPIKRRAEFKACPTHFLVKRANQRIDSEPPTKQ